MLNKHLLTLPVKLELFPFNVQMLSCRNIGSFPDLAIRINREGTQFSGGELVEMKDSATYSVASFNSTIPTGKKRIRDIIASEGGNLYQQMIASGDDVDSVPIRDVFYLIRGRQRGNTKICLVHGSFFETVTVETLIREAFSQVLDEGSVGHETDLTPEIKNALVKIFGDQRIFSRVRDIPNASVKLRFRIMTEAKAEGNILRAMGYPQIGENTLNLVVPVYTLAGEALERERMQTASSGYEYEIFRIKHPFNGEFLVHQTELTQ